MSELLNFAAANQWFTFLLCWLVLWCTQRCAKWAAIAIRGWPPEGLDADGDAL